MLWEDYHHSMDGPFMGEIRGQVFQADDPPVGGEFRIDRIATRGPLGLSVTALDDGGFFVVWIGDSADGAGSHIRGQAFDRIGSATAPAITVGLTLASSKANPSATPLVGGSLIVMWKDWCETDADGPATVLRGQVIGPARTKVGSGFALVLRNLSQEKWWE